MHACMVCRVELEEVRRALGLALAQCGVDQLHHVTYSKLRSTSKLHMLACSFGKGIYHEGGVCGKEKSMRLICSDVCSTKQYSFLHGRGW